MWVELRQQSLFLRTRRQFWAERNLPRFRLKARIELLS